jgi:methenyltetrahydromethanopterin cyclohydrolase
MQLNAGAWRIVEQMLARRQALAVDCHTAAGGVRIVDCGVEAAGGIEAGVELARAAMAGLGAVAVADSGMEAWPDCPWPVVQVATD